MIRAPEESMSGKKKLFRRTVVLVNSRRRGGRRRVRPAIAHRASMQFAFALVIIAVLVTSAFLLRNMLQ
uniref:Uncharacterized protein n=1 Tax=Rhizobium leguminosarum TaxID=384 RepID=A0A179BEV8_RHILE|nr:hypothetical protein A4U53_30335 [Rhizobium leguminosarum]